MDLEWRGHGDNDRYGWCGGFQVAQVLRNRNGWRGFVRHDPVDGVDYPTAGEAQAVVEAAVADEPDPVAVRPPKRWRRVPNEPE
jgi:hypothetical protein